MERGASTFAGYALGETLGGGGSATVHLGSRGPAEGAARPRSLVAIKKWRGVVGESTIALLREDVRRASRVRHANVAAPLELCGEAGEVAVVSELVLGETLWMLLSTAHAAGEAVPLRVATGILCGVLHGLEAVHGAKSDDGLPLGLVHGDVGAHNVIVGNDGVARLTDLGTGRVVAAELTSGKPTSKLAYAAPELVLGQRVDRRADVYSASILFFEIATGQRPFEDVPVDRLAAQIALGLRPDDLRAARGLPREVLGVIARGLARRPQERFATAGEMVRAIVQAAMPATPREIAAWAERLADPAAWGRAASLERRSSAPPVMTPQSIVATESIAKMLADSAPPPAPLSSSVPVVLTVGTPSRGNIEVTTGNIDVTTEKSGRRRRRARFATTIAMAAVGLVFGAAGLLAAGAPAPRASAAAAPSACDEPTTASSLWACARERASAIRFSLPAARTPGSTAPPPAQTR